LVNISETSLLPSKGILYDGKVGPEVTLRAMSTFEEKMRFAGGVFVKTMGQIIKNCSVEPENLDYRDLLLADYQFILFQLRVITYGTVMAHELECPHCLNTFKHMQDLDKVPLSYLDEKEIVKKDKDGKALPLEPISIKLKRSGDTLGCRLLRAGDLEYIDARSREILRRFKEYVGSPEYIVALARQIVTVNGQELSDDKKEEYVNKMHAYDANYIQHILSKYSFGLDLEFMAICPKCSGEVEYGVPMDNTFFRPHFDD